MWYDCVWGASRDVELVSWPQMSVGAVHGEGELLITPVLSPELPRCAAGVLGEYLSSCAEGGSPSMNFPGVTCMYSALLLEVEGKKGLIDLFLNRKPAGCVQTIQYFF